MNKLMKNMTNSQKEKLVEKIAQAIDDAFGARVVNDGDLDPIYKLIEGVQRKTLTHKQERGLNMNKDKTIEKRAGFTQGEWAIRECPQGGHYEGGEDPFTISADGKFIASIKLQSRNTQANARLIANSPAMYDMLRDVLVEYQAEAKSEGWDLPIIGEEVRELLANVDGRGEG